MQEIHFEIHELHDFRPRTTGNQHHLKKNLLYDIIWVTAGDVELFATGPYYAHSDVVYCFKPGQLKQIINKGFAGGFHIVVPADFLCIAGFTINVSLLGGRYADDPQPVVMKINKDTKKDALDLLLKMVQEFNQCLTLRLEIMRGLFNIFLLYLSRECATKSYSIKASRDWALVDNFFRLLHDSPKTKKQVKQYATELNLTPNYLNQIIKKITGFHASYHIQQQIIMEAKKRALNARCSMKEVAYELGFESMAHFSKFFKTNSGVNFTNFKRESLCLQR